MIGTKNKALILTLFSSQITFGFDVNQYKFNKIVATKLLEARCIISKGNEVGIFAILYREGAVLHDFLVLTGVYYESCKNFERDVTHLIKSNSVLKLIGSQNYPPHRDAKNPVWRWHSIRTISRKKCLSYFPDDCKEEYIKYNPQELDY